MPFQNPAFTLLECLVTLCLISIFILMISSHYQNAYTHTLAKSDQKQVQHAILFARTLALSEHTSVQLRLQSAPAGGQDRLSLWIKRDTYQRYYQFQACQKGARLQWRGVGTDALSFSRTLTGQAVNGRFVYYLPGDSKPYWEIIVNRLGDARVRYLNKT